MKKIVFLLSISFVLLTTSCNKNNRVSKQIDGEWNIDIAELKQESNGTIIYDETFINFGKMVFHNDNSKGYSETQVGYSEITQYYLSNDGTILNIEFDGSGENIQFVISDYNKKSTMTLTNESTSQGVKTMVTYSLTKK